MTPIDTPETSAAPAVETHGPAPLVGTGRRRSGIRRSAILGGTLVAGMVFGAGGLAYGAMVTGHMGWGHGPGLDRVQQMVRFALDDAGATTAQEDKIHDIVAAGYPAVVGEAGTRAATMREALDLLRAPTVDRAAVEKLRADRLAAFDARTKAMVGIVLDAAAQLTPDQRARLADRADRMMQRRAEGGRWWGGGHETPTDMGAPRPGEDDRRPGEPGADRNPG